MSGDFSNIIVNVLDAISRWFADMSCRVSEIFDDGNVGKGSGFKKSLCLVSGALVILIYGLVGFVYGIVCILLSAFTGREAGDMTFFKRKELLMTAAACLSVFLALFFLARADYARNANNVYYDSRSNINDICTNLQTVNNSDYDTYVYNLRKVLESKKSSPAVMTLRRNIDDELPENLCFATVSDYLVTLLSLEQYDVLENIITHDYFVQNDDQNDYRMFRSYLASSCKDSFRYGRFYKSEYCLDLYLNMTRWKDISSFPQYNNSFYLILLFNERIIERYFASNTNNGLLADVVDDVENIQYVCGELQPGGSEHEDEIIKYLNAVAVFDNSWSTMNYPTDEFESLYKRTSSDVMKQYSLNMALRSQFSKTARIISNGKDYKSSYARLDGLRRLADMELVYPYLRSSLGEYRDERLWW